MPALQSLQTYAYDANGNRTGTGLLVDTASNRLRQAQSQPVVTNAAGEITWQAGRALRFDAGGRLHQVKACASATDSACASSEDGATRHWYNGQHQRVLKDEPTGQTVYAYGTAGHNVLGEYRQAAGAGAVQSTEHIYLPTASGPMPVAAVINGQHFAVHADHLNTPRRLTDSASRVRWQWAYSGYGETAPQALTLPSVANVAYNLRYPGQVDDGNGLFYNWHRFYHPASGRYVSADPIGLDGGWNRFAYVGGNPLSYVDPTGLDRGWADRRMGYAYDLGRGFKNYFDRLGQFEYFKPLDAESVALAFCGSTIGSAVRGAIWSSTSKLSSIENALGHWNKHKADFPELVNSTQYVEAAHTAVTHPPSGAFTKARGRDTLFYDPTTNTFSVKGADGSPKTMFRPTDGINYWNKQ